MPHFAPNKGRALEIAVGDDIYLRLPIRTRLITGEDDILSLMKEYVAPHIEPGDIVFISEKIVAITQNRIVRIRDIKPSWLARFLAQRVDNKRGTADFKGFGHGTSVGMQLFIEEAGYSRVFLAALLAAVTRPLGIKGVFYMVSGKNAKSVDCPMSFTLWPYIQYAKRAPLDPAGVAKQVKKLLGSDAAIVDANYQGAFSLGKSDRGITERFIEDVLKDNPAGQSDEMTPFFIIRKKPGIARAL